MIYHFMKKVLLGLSAAVLLLATVSCTKERICRCSVLSTEGGFGGQTIRIIKIDKGTCEQLRFVLYDMDPVLHPNLLDSVLCTDFDFEEYVND